MNYFEFRQGELKENSRSYTIEIQRSMNERTRRANVQWTFERVNRLAGGLKRVIEWRLLPTWSSHERS